MNENITNLVCKFNDKCDTCLKVFKMVAVVEGEKICLDCLKKQFKEKHGINPSELKLDKNTEAELNKTIDKIVEEIKKNDK